MLRKALALGVVLAASLSAPWVATAGGSIFGEEPSDVAGAPFSAVAKLGSVTTFTDGNQIVRSNTVRYFRDGKGRTRTERGDGPNRLILINDPVGGQRYIIRPESKVVLALKGTDASSLPPALGGPAEEELTSFALLGLRMGIGATPTTEASSSTTSLGQKSVSGLAVTGTRLVREIPSGVLGNEKPITSTLDRWVSADLGVSVQVVQKSSIGGEITLNLSQVVRAEPDPTLFVPPAGYPVRDIHIPARAPADVASSTTIASGSTAN